MTAWRKHDRTLEKDQEVYVVRPERRQRSLGVLVEKGFDPVEFVFAESKPGSADYAVHLIRPPATDDGRRHRRVPQGPSDGHLPRGATVLPTYFLQQLHQLQVFGEPGFLEVGAVATPVVGGEVPDALTGHLARKQAAPHRRVDDDADILLSAVGQYLLLYTSVEHVVWRLQGLDWGYLLRPLHLRDVEVRDPDMPDLPLLFELRKSLPTLLNVLFRVGPVDLVQVYDVRLQPTEALLALAFYGIFLQDVVDLAALIPDKGALGEDVGTLGDTLEGSCDELLGVPEAVDGGGVDPVAPELDGALYAPPRFVVALRPPGSSPSAPADGPAPEAYGRDLQPRLAERALLQSRLLF